MGTANCFYAVRKGVRPGIYESWDECKPNVHKFKGCIFAKFKTRKEASSYMQAKTVSPVIKKKLPVASPVQAMGMPSQAIPYPRSETRDASLLSLAREFVSLAREAEAEDIPKLQDIRTDAGKLPLICEMARLSGNERYVLARKSAKLYMKNVLKVEVNSITTDHRQTLCLDGKDAEYMKGKRVVIVDDVISTGESLHALEKLLEQVGCDIVGRMAILAEGEAADRKDLIFLEKLPLFNGEGKPID